MSKTGPGKEKDFWDKIAASAKFLGGLGAVIGAVLIPWILQSQSEKNQKVQVYAEIMSQREAGDTEIRAKMFDSLLLKYLTISSNNNNKSNSENSYKIDASDENKSKSRKDEIKTFKEKIVFLSILMENFQEYFNARSLFEDLYEKIDEAEDAEKVLCNKNTDNSTKKSCNEANNNSTLIKLKTKLIKLSRRNASKQISMLSGVGLVSDMIHVKKNCMSSTRIPLFKIEETDGSKTSNNVKTQLRELDDNNCCNEDRDEKECDNNKKGESEWWDNPNIITLKKNQYSSFFGKAKERNFHAITIRVKKIEYPQVGVEVNLYEYKLEARKPKMNLISERPFKFSVSYFDMPYMDNTRIIDGERFALVLKSICTKDSKESDCDSPSLKELAALKEFDKFLDKIQAAVEEKADFNDPNKFIDSETIEMILSSDKTAAFYSGLTRLLNKFHEDLEKIQNKSENDARNEEAKKKLKDELQELKEDIEFEIDVTSDSVNQEPYAVFQVVTFKEEFMSLRDRPLFEEMLNKLQAN